MTNRYARTTAYMEQTPLERLREQSGISGIHYSRCAVGLTFSRDGAHVGAASALLVGNPARSPEFCLVSVRHAISRARTCHIAAEIGYPAQGNRLETRPITVPYSQWVLAEDDDLACTPFPVEHLEPEHLLRCAHIDQLKYMAFDAAPEATLSGRWGEGEKDGYIISRSGRLATMERPEVRLYIGDDIPRITTPVHVVDATISRGMSGGFAAMHMTPFTIIGLICAHGILPAPLSIQQLPDGAQQIASAIWEGVGAVNAGLAYLVPVDRIQRFLMTTMWR